MRFRARAHQFIGSSSTIAIHVITRARNMHRKTEVSSHRYETLQKFFAIVACFKMLRFCVGKGTDFVSKNPCSVNLNVSAHKDQIALR